MDAAPTVTPEDFAINARRFRAFRKAFVEAQSSRSVMHARLDVALFNWHEDYHERPYYKKYYTYIVGAHKDASICTH